MATAAAAAPLPTSCPEKDTTPYERIVLEPTPDLEKEIEEAKSFLDSALCSMPVEEDYGDDEKEEYEKDLEEISTRSKELLPTGFPYTAYYDSDEDILDQAIFKTYKGAVYWNDCGRDFIIDPEQPKENFMPENMHKLKYTSLAPIKIHAGGDKGLTLRGLCEAVAALNYNPGEHVFLENIDIQLREIEDKEAMTIVFYTGS